LDPKALKVAQVHGYLLGAVAPRPIALVSTVDADGNPNLSPFSFFNVFSANPPIAIFSPARRGRDNTTKHTYENAKIHKECVINIVNFDMVQQMSLSSTEYPKGVNEFIKSGFTPIDSEVVKPPRVMESPVQLECIIKEVIELGKEEFHAELVHDDKLVTIYVLDSAAKNSVPVDVSEVVINILHDGKPEQFKLAAAPQESDPSGKSSRFVANDPELASHLDDEAAAPKLAITISGKSYRGTITHEHDHAH
jgi:flavin reductase (DIM6/NTAB) family NADH-FMN oxidoreductase RutF